MNTCVREHAEIGQDDAHRERLDPLVVVVLEHAAQERLVLHLVLRELAEQLLDGRCWSLVSQLPG
ncbi:MAG: hypothetical protein MZV65_01270 [Chromatiales bacterium]|nr:hypothetical protein [Chromatiales bacterium]